MGCTFCDKKLNAKDFVCVVWWQNDSAKETSEFCDYVCVARFAMEAYADAMLQLAEKQIGKMVCGDNYPTK